MTCLPCIPTETNLRHEWVDTARAFGIVAVVLGHTQSLPEPVVRIIYSFHMPLFFFLAGYVLKSQHLAQSLAVATRRGLKRLIVPYTVFWVVSFLFWLAIRSFGGWAASIRSVRLTDPVIGWFVGTGAALSVNVVLWFFTCLFVTTLAFHVIHRLRTPMGIAAALLVCGGVGHLFPHVFPETRLPWNLEVALIGVGFYGLGHLARGWEAPRRFRSGSALVVTALFSLSVNLFASLSNTGVSMNDMKYGHIGLFYLGAVSGIVFVMAVSRLIPPGRAVRFLSDNTVVVFPTHLLFFRLFTGIGVIVFGVASDFNSQSLFWSFAYTLSIFVISVPLARWIRQFAPWAIGLTTESTGTRGRVTPLPNSVLASPTHL